MQTFSMHGQHGYCAATPVRRSRDTSTHSGSLADSQSAPEQTQQSESKQEYYPTKSDQDSSQDDSSDNPGAEPEKPPPDSQKRRGKFNSRRDSRMIHKNHIHHLHQLNISSLIDFKVLNARTSFKDTRRGVVLLYRSSRRKIESKLR